MVVNYEIWNLKICFGGCELNEELWEFLFDMRREEGEVVIWYVVGVELIILVMVI